MFIVILELLSSVKEQKNKAPQDFIFLIAIKMLLLIVGQLVSYVKPRLVKLTVAVR